MSGVNPEPNMLSDINKMGNNSINNIETVSSQHLTTLSGGASSSSPSWLYSANIHVECDQFPAECAVRRLGRSRVPTLRGSDCS